MTRSMLLTGNDPIEVGLAAFDYTIYPPSEGKPGYEAHLTRNTATVAEILQDAGYQPTRWASGTWVDPAMAVRARTSGASIAATGSTPAARTTGTRAPFTSMSTIPKSMAVIERGEIPQEPYYENGQRVKRPLGIYSDDLWTSKLLEYHRRGIGRAASRFSPTWPTPRRTRRFRLPTS